MPRETTLPAKGRQTILEGKDTLEQATIANARQRVNTASILSDMASNMVRASDSAFNQASQAIKDIPTVAAEARKVRLKGQAQQIVIETKLLLDEKLQELQRSPDVEPLDLADVADRTIKQFSDRAIDQGAQLGADMRAYVQDKMGAYRLSQVPKIRREGFKRETEQALAGLQQRNFLRQSEMNQEGTDAQRRSEIVQEMIDDIGSHIGIHLAADDAQKMIEDLATDAIKQTWFDLLQQDPLEAFKSVQKLGLSPEEEIKLANQAESILKSNAAEERAQAKFEVWQANQRAEALEDEVYTRMYRDGFNPARLVGTNEGNILGADKLQSLIARHDWKIENARQEVERSAAYQSELTYWRERAQSGMVSPSEIRQQFFQAVESETTRLRPEDFGAIQAVTKNSWDTTISINKAEYKESVGKSRNLLSEFFKPLTDGIQNMFGQEVDLGLTAKSRAARLGAMTKFDSAVRQAWMDALEQDQDPLSTINVPAIMFQTIQDSIPAIQDLYVDTAGAIDNKALKSLVLGAGSTALDVANFQETLAEQEAMGKLSETDKKWALMYTNTMEALTSMPGVVPGQSNFEPPSVDTVEANALRRELGIESGPEAPASSSQEATPAQPAPTPTQKGAPRLSPDASEGIKELLRQRMR